MDEGDAASTEPGAGETSADAPGGLEGGFDHSVEFRAGDFEVVAEADVALGEEFAGPGEVAFLKSLGEVKAAVVFGHDVAGSFEESVILE